MGLTPIAGGTGAAVMVKETGTVTGVTPVPAAERDGAALGADGERAGVAALNVMVPLPVPVPALRVNQVAASLAVQVKVPPPVLLMLSVCVGRVAAALGGREGDARGARADGRGHRGRGDGEGDGNGDRGCAGRR